MCPCLSLLLDVTSIRESTTGCFPPPEVFLDEASCDVELPLHPRCWDCTDDPRNYHEQFMEGRRVGQPRKQPHRENLHGGHTEAAWWDG